MRKGYGFAALVGLLGLGGVLAVGCIDAVADYYTPLTNPELATWSDGGPEGGDGGPDGEGGPPPNCDPTVGAVDESCGVFVSASAPSGGKGTKTSPYNSLQTAVGQAGGKHVYACADAPFSEAVTIAASVQLWGGFADCTTEAGWSWSQNARSTLNGSADAVALTLTKGADGTTVEGFAVVAGVPSDPMGGGSSIAVALADITATLDHCDVTAKNGAAGPDGQTPTTPVVNGTSAPAPDPSTMNACILPASVNGGAPGVTMCGSIDTSGGIGGKGGIPSTAADGGTADSNGQQGAGGLPTSNTTGLGGAGESASKCSPGGTGNDGNSGNAGPGGSIAGDTLSIGGITNVPPDGEPGTPGQGGGGGGGAKSGTFCPPSANPVDGPGASGGGGGAGGCGGLGGGGGKAGGSSIAIVSLGTKLTLTNVTLTVGTGGNGGKGVIGQGGGLSGSGASGGAPSGFAGSAQACRGGDGGAGGPGGAGGGGRGGHAIGIAYAKAPATMPSVTFTAGMPGSGGTAGNGAPASSNGAMGNSGACWDFTMHAACM